MDERFKVPYPFYMPSNPLLVAAPAVKKRNVFFSFHFADVMNANVIRNSWKISHPDAEKMRMFYDYGLWERSKTRGVDNLKRLIREGVEYTSAVCVLIGNNTWQRRWVRYEIARAVIDGRGLLGIHLNSIGSNPLYIAALGENPFNHIGVGPAFPATLNPLAIPEYYLWERQGPTWVRYADHSQCVRLPKYVIAPDVGYVRPLSQCASVYDYKRHDAHRNLGAWIDQAAQAVGR